MNVYADGWILSLKALINVAEDACYTPISAIQAALNVPPVSAPKSQEGNGSRGYPHTEI